MSDALAQPSPESSEPPAGLDHDLEPPREIGLGRLDRPRLGWTEFVVAVVAYLVLQILTTGAAIALYGVTPPAPVLLVGSGLSAFGAVGIAIVLRVRSVAALGMRRVPGRTLLVALALGGGVWVVSRLLIAAYIGITGDTSDPQQALTQFAGVGAATAVVVLGGLVVPAGEELLFRGVLYGSLRRYGGLVAGTVASLLFALAHGLNVVFPAVLVLAVLNAVLYERTRSVWPCIVVHATFNLLSFILVLVLHGTG